MPIGVGRPVEVDGEGVGSDTARPRGAHEARELGRRLGTVAQHQKKRAELDRLDRAIQDHAHGLLGFGLVERAAERGAAADRAQEFGERMRCRDRGRSPAGLCAAAERPHRGKGHGASSVKRADARHSSVHTAREWRARVPSR